MHHHHDKDHASASMDQYGRFFMIATVANSLFVVFQVIFAIISNSTSLLADAIHNLGDVLSLVLAWAAHNLMNKMPSEQATYGMKKTSIMAALANGLLMVFSCGIIATEAIYKLISPGVIEAIDVMIVAALGIVVNGATAMLFAKGGDDLNIRAAFLHLLYDALISVGVVIAAFLIYLTGWYWIDALVGLLIAAIILRGTLGLFTDSFRLLMDAVPKSIIWSDVRDWLLSKDGVEELHDLHIWALSTRENALSVHLFMPEFPLSDEYRMQIEHDLKHKFNIHHVTIQIERSQAVCDYLCKHD